MNESALCCKKFRYIQKQGSGNGCILESETCKAIRVLLMNDYFQYMRCRKDNALLNSFSSSFQLPYISIGFVMTSSVRMNNQRLSDFSCSLCLIHCLYHELFFRSPRPGGCSLSQNNECSVHLRLLFLLICGSFQRLFCISAGEQNVRYVATRTAATTAAEHNAHSV